MPALCQVLHHMRKSVRPVRPIAQRGDYRGGPEQRAVLAEAPTLLGVSPGGSGVPQMRPWFALQDILARVEMRYVLPEDLLALVSLNPLGAGIPAGHETILVEHHDGVFGHAIDQQPEPL